MRTTATSALRACLLLAAVAGLLPAPAGAGAVTQFKSVSGSIRGTFAGQAGGPTRWQTVSGDLEIALARGLDADLLLASRWGEIWSAFELAPLPAPPATASTRNGSYVIRTDQGARFRVGSGGPELHLETLSGDIRIRKNEGD